jgi:hypothetical protein
MKTAHAFFAAVAVVGSITGCTAPAAEEAGTDEAAATAADKACATAKPTSDESTTSARARCLTEYATRLMDEQALGREDRRDVALKGIKVSVVGETGCFTEDVKVP